LLKHTYSDEGNASGRLLLSTVFEVEEDEFGKDGNSNFLNLWLE
jgi:hypothetical protein